VLSRLARHRRARYKTRGLVLSLGQEMEYHRSGADGPIMRKAAEALGSFGASDPEQLQRAADEYGDRFDACFRFLVEHGSLSE
jgi:hypothetical protein